MQRLEAAFHRTRSQRREGPHRPGDALEVLCPEVLKLEQIAEKPSRALGDDDHVRLGDPLQTRRKVRRLADDAALLRLTRSDQVADDDQARGNTDPCLQGNGRLERAHRRDHFQPCPHRPLGVVLMGLRIAEVDEHAVAHVFGHEAVEAAHGLGDAFLIGRNDLAQVLRVHAGGECRRADKVREHHRDLAALGAVFGRDARGTGLGRHVNRGRLGGARLVAQSSDCFEQYPAMPNRTDADFLQVLLRQARKDPFVNLVLAECRLILFEAEAPQPTSDVHDSALTPSGAHDRRNGASRAPLLKNPLINRETDYDA